MDKPGRIKCFNKPNIFSLVTLFDVKNKKQKKKSAKQGSFIREAEFGKSKEQCFKTVLVLFTVGLMSLFL